jgi:hypothetical protein
MSRSLKINTTEASSQKRGTGEEAVKSLFNEPIWEWLSLNGSYAKLHKATVHHVKLYIIMI